MWSARTTTKATTKTKTSHHHRTRTLTHASNRVSRVESPFAFARAIVFVLRSALCVYAFCLLQGKRDQGKREENQGKRTRTTTGNTRDSQFWLEIEGLAILARKKK